MKFEKKWKVVEGVFHIITAMLRDLCQCKCLLVILIVDDFGVKKLGLETINCLSSKLKLLMRETMSSYIGCKCFVPLRISRLASYPKHMDTPYTAK